MKKLLLVFAAAAAAVCGAADKYWTGAAGDGKLLTAGNWSDNTAPVENADSFHFDTPSETPVRVYFPECQGRFYEIPKITGTKDYTLVMEAGFVAKIKDLTEFAGNFEIARTFQGTTGTEFQFTGSGDTPVHGLDQQGYLYYNRPSYAISVDKLLGDGFTYLVCNNSCSFGQILGGLTGVQLNGPVMFSVGTAGSDAQSHVRFIDQLNRESPTFDIKGGGLEIDVLRTAAATTRLTKTGDGTLTVRDLCLGNEDLALQVNGGKVVFSHPVQPSADPQVAEGAFLHLDASRIDTFSFSDEANQVVSEWRDCRADATGKATPYGDKGPRRVADAVNGKAAVDFGVRKAADAGCLQFAPWNSACCQEGFLVLREKVAKSRAFFLGDINTYDFHPNDTGAFINRRNNSQRVAGGAWAFDGKTVIPWSEGLSSEAFHVVRFSLAEPARACFLCADRGSTDIGGWEMAEVVIYSTALTEQQRVDTEACLLRKWLAKDHPNVTEKAVVRNYSFGSGVDAVLATDNDVAVNSLAGGGRLVKEGAGLVTTRMPASFTELVVEGGKLDGEVSIEDGAFIHLDASDDDSIEKIDHPSDPDGHPGKYVKRWYDVRGNGRFAKLETNREPRPTEFPDIYPKVVEGGLNNQTYVDFGAPSKGLNNPGLWFNETCSDAREIFLVWKDNSTDASQMANAWPINSAYYCFHRGTKGEIGHSSNFFNRNENTLWLDDGFYPVATTVPSAGWHVMSIIVDPATKKRSDRETADVIGISADREARSGGVSIAEVIVFDLPLKEEQRAALRAKLMKKWLKPDTVVPSAEMSYDRVSVAAGATLKMNVNLTTDALDVGGTVETGVTVAEGGEIGVTVGRDGASGTTVNGAVMLPATGTVRLQLAEGVTKVKGGLYPILTSATGEFSFDGDIKDWTLTGDYQSVIKNRVRLVVKEDGLYLELPKPGLVLIVR